MVMDKEKNYYNVLIVGSDEASTQTIKHWLQDYAKITSAKSISNGIRMLGTGRWNLLIIDTSKLGLAALDQIEIAKENNSELPILIISHNKDTLYLPKVVEMHVDGLLFKPLIKSTFLTLAKKLIKLSSSSISNQRVVLAIGAHPDDVEIGCGGSLARHYAHGDQIVILTVSLGGAGGNGEKRKQESQKAAKILGAKLFIKSLADTMISEGVSTIEVIEEVVRQIKPSHIYTHTRHDNHQDHRNVHMATIVACRSVPNLYCYQSPSSTIEFKPNLFIDIAKHLDKKIAALSCHRSQITSRPYLSEKLIEATARYWGRYINYSLAEAMEIVREAN